MQPTGSQEPVALKRSLGPVMVTFYGLGTIIGAGIYVLLGSVAGYAGNWLPASFILAGMIATLTALSYAELSSRLPYCAGAALYVQEAWHRRRLSALVGYLLVLTGIVSAATIANGFVGYLNVFLEVRSWLAISALLLLLGLLAAWDMQASAIAVFLVTILEVAGLLLVAYYAGTTEAIAPPVPLSVPLDGAALSGIVLGGFLAFYAFIGFEDLVNIVEEVKQPRRTMPLGILLSVFFAVLLYCVVAVAALRVMPAAELATSAAPLADVMAAGGGSGYLISIISLVAVINGALVQIIMASRVLYGMAEKHMAPAFMGRISARTRTPLLATALVVLIILVFALTLPLTQLAQLTSLIMLVVFSAVNLALIRLKRRSSLVSAAGSIDLPVWVPALGCGTACALLLYQLVSAVTR